MNRYEAELRRIALAYPEVHEDFPWAERETFPRLNPP
jgi:hypothetical protein